MSARPNILITPSTQKQGAEFLDASISLSDRYPAAVLAGGGVPWITACIPDPDYVTNAVRRADGVLLTGGDDLQPKLYRDDVPARLGKTVLSVSPARDLFEMLLVRAALSEQKPILAICRGHQLLNVALGGTLIVDIPLQLPSALKHNRPDRRAEPVHEVTVAPGTLLARATARTRLGVNSTHHQAVEQVAEPLRVSAQSEDGIVEGLELKPEARRMSPFLASVQFHPERLYDRYGEFLDLFRAFIRACRTNGRGGP